MHSLFPSIFLSGQFKKDESLLNGEWLIKTFESFGLKRSEVEVYIYLLQHDPTNARDIALALEVYKRQLYRSLKSLQHKGMVNASQDHPAIFSAVALKEVLNQLIQLNNEAAQLIEENKDQILSMWRSKILGEQ
jgi:sugar-specific transcriptional regulator TrmB